METLTDLVKLLLDIIIAAAGIHAATAGHAAPIISAFLAGPSIVALTAAALCKAAARPMPAPRN